MATGGQQPLRLCLEVVVSPRLIQERRSLGFESLPLPNGFPLQLGKPVMAAFDYHTNFFQQGAVHLLLVLLATNRCVSPQLRLAISGLLLQPPGPLQQLLIQLRSIEGSASLDGLFICHASSGFFGSLRWFIIHIQLQSRVWIKPREVWKRRQLDVHCR